MSLSIAIHSVRSGGVVSCFNESSPVPRARGRSRATAGADVAADKSIGAGFADSCAACSRRPRGSAGFGGDVVTRPHSWDAPHLFGLGLKEMLADEITAGIRKDRDEVVAEALATRSSTSRKLSTKGIEFATIRANS